MAFRKTGGEVRFYDDEVYLFFQKKTKRNLEKAMKHAENECKKLLRRRSGPGHSRPGEAPYLQSGDLHDSIDSGVEEKDSELRGYLSSDSPYALRLELGFYGTDSMGRLYKQAPRPFLRRTLNQEKLKIKAIILSG